MLKAQGLEYQAHGDGEAVLLIHGALVADAMLPLTREAALADKYRLISYRRRGHGGSDPVSGLTSMEQQAEDAQALLDHLGVKRAHVVGHSGGGVFAVELALQAPDLVRSLVVLEPAIMPSETMTRFIENVAPILEAHRGGDDRQAVDQWMKIAGCGDDWRRVITGSVPGGAEQAEKDASTFFDFELPSFPEWRFDAERASRISQPVLHVLGAESGPMMEAGKRHFMSLIPKAEQVVLPGVNHAMQMADAKRVAEPIADFLSRHPL